ncbi:MAG: hypothetical protein ACO34E_15285, partial [Limisphaerales bacterium]
MSDEIRAGWYSAMGPDAGSEDLVLASVVGVFRGGGGGGGGAGSFTLEERGYVAGDLAGWG